MTRKAKPHPHKKPAPAADTLAGDATTEEAAFGEVVDRPDGFYWRSPDGMREGGPFETPELAREDMDASEVPDQGPIESLQEVEREIGVADWIDPETGEPAEGMAPPRLGDE